MRRYESNLSSRLRGRGGHYGRWGALGAHARTPPRTDFIARARAKHFGTRQSLVRLFQV